MKNLLKTLFSDNEISYFYNIKNIKSLSFDISLLLIDNCSNLNDLEWRKIISRVEKNHNPLVAEV